MSWVSFYRRSHSLYRECFWNVLTSLWTEAVQSRQVITTSLTQVHSIDPGSLFIDPGSLHWPRFTLYWPRFTSLTQVHSIDPGSLHWPRFTPLTQVHSLLTQVHSLLTQVHSIDPGSLHWPRFTLYWQNISNKHKHLQVHKVKKINSNCRKFSF